MSKVLVLRLPAGEELIGRVVLENDFEIVLKDTHMVHTQWEQTGTVKFGMSPFMVYTKDNKQSFVKNSLTVIAECEPGLEKEYLSRTSGIVLAK